MAKTSLYITQRDGTKRSVDLGASAKNLQAQGINLPPYHMGCRTDYVVRTTSRERKRVSDQLNRLETERRPYVKSAIKREGLPSVVTLERKDLKELASEYTFSDKKRKEVSGYIDPVSGTVVRKFVGSPGSVKHAKGYTIAYHTHPGHPHLKMERKLKTTSFGDLTNLGRDRKCVATVVLGKDRVGVFYKTPKTPKWTAGKLASWELDVGSKFKYTRPGEIGMKVKFIKYGQLNKTLNNVLKPFRKKFKIIKTKVKRSSLKKHGMKLKSLKKIRKKRYKATAKRYRDCIGRRR